MTDGDKARDDFFNRQFKKERQEQEAYAAAHGYTVKSGKGGHYVYSRQRALPAVPLANCALREDAVRVAYALAMLGAGDHLPG